MNPNPNTNAPLVQSSEAVADAQAVLDRVSDDWAFVVDVSSESAGASSRVGAQINNRGELRFSNQYVQVAADNKTVDGVALMDKIDDVPAPALASTISAFLDSQEYVDFTVVSASELHLILAEAALAARGGETGATFEQHINAVRNLHGLTAYSGQLPPREMLVHSRRVNLFLRGYRLANQYRFGITSPEWTSLARPGALFPISATERRSNPNID